MHTLNRMEVDHPVDALRYSTEPPKAGAFKRRRPDEDNEVVDGSRNQSSNFTAHAHNGTETSASPPAPPQLMTGRAVAPDNSSSSHLAAASDDSIDLNEAYVPGVLLHLPQVTDAARRIAAAFGVLTKWEDDDGIAASVKKNELAAADLRGRLSSAVSRGEDAQLVKNTEAALRQVERQLSDARATLLGRFRRNVRDGLLRVTLLKDAALAGDKPASAGGAGASSSSGGAGASSGGGVMPGLSGDVLYVQAPRTQCNNCGNRDEARFLHEYRSGDVTCAVCGVVAVERSLYDGDWTRSFEGEESTSQIGPRPDPLMSSAYNLRTSMALTQGVSKASLRALRETQGKADMLALGNDLNERRTREAFKDNQKQRCFDRLQDVGERLRIATGVVDRSKAFFAAFRDAREHVTKLDEAVAACLVVAVEEAVYHRMQADARQQGSAALSGDGGTTPLLPLASPTSSNNGSVGGSKPAPKESDEQRRARMRGEGQRRETEERRHTKLHRVAVLDFASAEVESRKDKKKQQDSAAAELAAGKGAGASSSSSAAAAARKPGKGAAMLSFDDDAGVREGLSEDEEEEDSSTSKKGFERFSMVSSSAVTAAAAAARGAGAGSSSSSSMAASASGGAIFPARTVASRTADALDAYVDVLYARAAERETNPDLEERDEYKAPS